MSVAMAVKWLVHGGDIHRFHENVYVEKVQQRDGSYLFKVERLGDVLNRDGEWEYEPQPSSRDDDYLARTRYGSFDEALAAFRRIVSERSRSVGGER